MLPQTEQIPQRFGRYVLLDRMGHGGMASAISAGTSTWIAA